MQMKDYNLSEVESGGEDPRALGVPRSLVIRLEHVLDLADRATPFTIPTRSGMGPDKGVDVGIDLSDNEIVDVEELGQPLHGKVGVDAPVGKHLPRAVRDYVPPFVLGHELLRWQQAWQGARGHDGTPQKDAGAAQVI